MPPETDPARPDPARQPYRLVRRPAGPVAPPLAADPLQRVVIDHTGGPLLVVGGPGTGKTTTLIEAVAARIAGGADPERILVLTFGRRAAAALRARIEARIARREPGAGPSSGAVLSGAGPSSGAVLSGAAPQTVCEPPVRTFHGYAFGLLRRAAVQRGEPAPRLLTGPEQDLIIRELLAAAVAGEDPVGWPDSLRPALPTQAFAGQLRDLLLRAAERGIGAADLAALGQRLDRPDWLAAARFMREYAAVLALREATTRDSVGYDNAELIRAAVGLLRADADLLAAERRRLGHIYVDELADTDPAQVDLLELIAGAGAPLVAFADPDSSTFGFRGADPAGVRDFPHRFRGAAGGPARTVTLTRSYRAGTELIGAAGRVARRLRGPARHRQLTPAPALAPAPAPRAGSGEATAARQPRPGGPGALEIRTFRTATSEAAYLAHRLREAHLRDGVPWSRMAVLMRSTTRCLAPVRRALSQAGVPTVLAAEDLPLHAQPAVAPLLLLLRCALRAELLDESAALALLHSPLGGADPLAERRLRQGLRERARAAGDHRPSGVLLVAALHDPDTLPPEPRWAAPALAVGRLLATARQAAARAGATAEDVLWAVWSASGLAQRWTAAVAAADGSTMDGPGAGAGSGALQWRAAAADRDLDAVLVLFDAAARFTDRLPGARIDVFLDHVLGQQLPADTLAPVADRGEAVRLLTAHAAKGLEWDVVAVVGVQEGSWPDLRLRGSLLGSERLVDVAAGRAGAGVTASLAGQASALLDEERRLFYVAVTRARRRLLVSAVSSAGAGDGDGEEQPSRFLFELALPSATEPPSASDLPVAAGPDPVVDPDRPASAAPAGAPGRAPSGARPDHRAAGSTGGARSDPPATVSTGGAPAPIDVPLRRLPRALTLPALVAELRGVVSDPSCPGARRWAAAAELARLAEAGVPGAHPDDWWGLRPLSDDRPLAGDGEPVRVTPSTMDSALRCSLRWLLERHGGAGGPSTAQGIGNLVHAAAMLAEDATVDRAALVEYIAARFDAIELAARWSAGTERARAEAMVDKLLSWLADNPRRLLAIEREFTVHLAGHPNPVELVGRVDRLEIDEAGRLVVIDLKTGRSSTAGPADLAAHPQLGAYQVAVQEGAFAEYGQHPGGAALVQLGTGGQAREQAQPPVGEADDPGWARDMVRRTAQTMAASTFQAVANSRCRVCPVRICCPISGKGRQVVEPPQPPGAAPGGAGGGAR